MAVGPTYLHAVADGVLCGGAEMVTGLRYSRTAGDGKGRRRDLCPHFAVNYRELA